jgi:hypothetical protein
MTTKNESARAPSLALRRPSAAQRPRVEEPKFAPEPAVVEAQTNFATPTTETPRPPEPQPEPEREPVAAQTNTSSRTSVPKPTLSREAGRIEAEPDADFFVSIPRSKKNALKAHCAQAGISMRDWLLGVLNEKSIGTDDTSQRAQNKG